MQILNKLKFRLEQVLGKHFSETLSCLWLLISEQILLEKHSIYDNRQKIDSNPGRKHPTHFKRILLQRSTLRSGHFQQLANNKNDMTHKHARRALCGDSIEELLIRSNTKIMHRKNLHNIMVVISNQSIIL